MATNLFKNGINPDGTAHVPQKGNRHSEHKMH